MHLPLSVWIHSIRILFLWPIRQHVHEGSFDPDLVAERPSIMQDPKAATLITCCQRPAAAGADLGQLAKIGFQTV